MPTTLERVQKLVIEHLDVDPEQATPTAKLIDDLGADSLDSVELVMSFEEEFDVEIPDSTGAEIVTVDDAVKAIDKILASKA